MADMEKVPSIRGVKGLRQAQMLGILVEELPRFNRKNWREIDLGRLGIAGAGKVGICRIDAKLSRQQAHVHPGCIEFVLCFRGENMKCLHGGTEDMLRSGELFVAFPDEPHCIVDSPKGRFTYSLLFSADCRKGLFGFAPPEARALVKRLREAPARIFSVPLSVLNDFRRLISLYDDGGLGRLDRRMRMRLVLDSILLAVCDACDRGVRATVVRDPQVQALVDEIAQAPVQKRTLAEMCRRVGASRAGLVLRFKRLAGLPPHAYQLKCRISLAQRMMSGGRTLASIAHELGFSSLSHFSKAFRDVTGVPPTQWTVVE